ncbi:MAG: hypothetical protein JW910_00485, partial [Anaerolineae bacterium]|nr:hypothetical protein [Anaerolineae bacterium]
MPVIPNVPPFALEHASGNLAFLAAQAALSALGVGRSLAALAGASGDAFKFVYDAGPVREPLRDLRPFDTLAAAFASVGLRAEWVPEATLDHVRGQVEAHSKIKQPVLTSCLPGLDYHGFCLLVGYDEATDRLSYRCAAASPQPGTAYQTLSLRDSPTWSGPITGGPGWVDFPLLVIRGPLYDPASAITQRKSALETALALLHGEPIPYPAHAGAAKLARVPLTDRTAPQGLAGLAALSDDLGKTDLRAFDTLWRLDAQLSQLAWDRTLAALYLESWEGDAPARLIAQYRTIAHTAQTLATRAWEKRGAGIRGAEDLRAFVEGTAACVYALPPDPRVRDGVRSLGHVIDTPWGRALVLDTPERRASALGIAA